jgi:hypothetical protein
MSDNENNNILSSSDEEESGDEGSVSEINYSQISGTQRT